MSRRIKFSGYQSEDVDLAGIVPGISILIICFILYVSVSERMRREESREKERIEVIRSKSE